MDQFKSNTNELIDQGKEALKEVEKLTFDTLSEAAERLNESGKKLKTLVRENPGLTIAAGIAVGFVMAKLVKAKK
jgi:ElaB/YqjD/DUF883 family membrane-anchored ribosome-binding protein